MDDGKQVKELQMDEATVRFLGSVRSGKRRSQSMVEAVNGRRKTKKTRATQMKKKKEREKE
jgi:hypothetical protein